TRINHEEPQGSTQGRRPLHASRATLDATSPIDPKSSSTAYPTTAPDASLKLRHVSGYRIRDCRSNLFFGPTHDSLVFPAAALGVVQHIASRAIPHQSFFTQHKDDVVALVYHRGANIVASGEIGLNPVVHVWKAPGAGDEKPVESLATFNLGKGYKGVAGTACHSPDGKYILAAAQDNEHSLFLFDWSKPGSPPVATVRGGTTPIVDLAFNATSASLEFMSVGQKTVRLWTVDLGAKSMTSRNGVFGDKAEQQVVTCVTYLATEQVYVTGTANGQVLVWGKDGKVSKACVSSHPGAIFGLTALAGGQGGFATGGKEATVQVWTSSFEPKGQLIHAQSGSLATIRALDSLGHKLALGLDDGTIATWCLEHNHLLVHLEGHSCAKDAELWGLDVVDAKHIVTSGDDATVLVWDTHTGGVVARARLDGASRCVAANPAKNVVAVGMESGEVNFFSLPKLTHIGKVAVSKKPISVLAFSPNDHGARLAVGAHDTTIYILTSADGHKYTLLFTSVTAEGAAKQETNLAAVKALKWAKYTCTIGWATRGIWEEGQDGLDINACDRFQAGGSAAKETDPGLIVLGNDSSKVDLLRYPAPFGGRTTTGRKSYGGHASHVTQVKFVPMASGCIPLAGWTAPSCFGRWYLFAGDAVIAVAAGSKRD
ncbi:WD40-repeat-containing domain protein, partial [Catenaria anguillulae PL171]